VIYLWDAGPASGTAGSPETAFEMAAPYLAAGGKGHVEEAEVNLMPAGGGLASEHRRTGKAWHGSVKDGAPSWEAATEAAAGGTAESA
jgi:hypothetical protein